MKNRYEYEITTLDIDKYGVSRIYYSLEELQEDIENNKLPVVFNNDSIFELFTDNEGFIFKTDNVSFYGLDKYNINNYDTLEEGYIDNIHIFIYTENDIYRIFEVDTKTNKVKENKVWTETDDEGRVRVRVKIGNSKISIKNLIKNFRKV